MIGLVPLLASQNARSGQAYKATILADSPVGYWRLGEASGTSAADASGHGNTGTYVGGVTLGQPGAIQADPDGLVNTAVLFDGSSGYVDVVNPGWSLDDFTLECWFKTASSGTVRVLSRQGVSYMALRLTGGKLQGFNSASAAVITPATYNDGKWHQGAYVRKAGVSQTLYVDGTAVATGADTSGTIAPTADLTISSANGSSEFFPGTIDEPAIYATALSAARIAAHYAAAA